MPHELLRADLQMRPLLLNVYAAADALPFTPMPVGYRSIFAAQGAAARPAYPD